MDPAALRALVLLAVCGASAGLFVQELRGDWLVEFVRANALSLGNRQRLLLSMAAGTLTAVLLGAALLWRRGPAALRQAAHLLAPAVLLAVVPPLARARGWDALKAAAAIAVFVLLFERLVRISLTAAAEAPLVPGLARARALAGAAADRLRAGVPQWLRARTPAAVVVLAAAFYAVYMSVFTLWMHGRFQTYGYDLGQYDNIFWSTLHGYPLRCAPLGLTENWSELRNHAELSVFALLPFYALRPRADTLLVMQSVILALAAIPIYRIAARRIPRPQACVLALAYLLYPPLHGLQFYDFHFQPIAATFVLLTIDFVDERRWVPMALCFVVALGCREDIPVGLAVLGAFLALSGHRVRAGLVIAAVSATYFVVIRFIVMPRFGAWYFQDIYKDLLPDGARNFSGVIATLLTNPLYVLGTMLTADKLRYALQVLAPLAFLPLRRPWLVVSVVPGSIFTVLTTGYGPTVDIGFQYSAHFIPYVFPAAALALAACGEGVRRRAALAALVAGTLLTTTLWGAIPPRESIRGGFFELPMTPPTEADRQKHRDLQELNAMIPPDASVAVSEQEMPHISRLHTFSLRDTTDAEYLLYGVGSGFYGSNNAEQALARGEFEKIAERPGLVLLKRRRAEP